MLGNKQQRNIKQLCLLIAVILVCGAVPLESALAVESGTMLETEALTGETQTEEMQTGETLQEPETEPVKTDPGKEEPETAGSAETEPESNTDMGKYTNSISGVLWVDANEDGTYDSSEQALADYPVYLYLEGDTDNAVQTATTDADGKYLFEDITPGRYVAGIKAEEKGTEYLLPLVGVQKDNKFYFTPDYSKVISNPIDIAEDTVVEEIDAGMRNRPGIQTMAGVAWGLPNTWTTAADYYIAANFRSAQSTLDNGLVLVTGGGYGGTAVLSTARLYDPDTNTWSGAANMVARTWHAQSTLKDGRVLVTGGANATTITVTSTLNSTQIYDYNTNTWSAAANMSVALWGHAQSTLNDGRVLVTGGANGSNIKQSAAYIYDPNTNTWSTATSIPVVLTSHAQSTLPDGRVLVTGGYNASSVAQNTARIYDPNTNTWSTAMSMPVALVAHAQSTLPDGRVLVTGGYNASSVAQNTAYIYDPNTNTWSTATSMPATAVANSQSTLIDGRVFIVRGGSSVTTWIYTPEYFKVSLSATPTTTKVYSGGVDITATAENLYGTAATVNDMEWFCVPVSNTTVYTASTFDAAYTSATATDKGTLTGTAVSTTDTDFAHNVTINAVYWYKATMTISGVTYTSVKSIKIDNIYTPAQVLHQGLKDGTTNDYLYTGMLAKTTGGSSTYGIPYDLDGTTVLTSPSLGYDAIALVGGYTGSYWTLKTPSQEKNVTLNNTLAALGVSTPYTFDYELDPLAITVKFDSQSGAPSTIPDQYYMTTDTFGTLPTVTRTNYDFDGWFTAATGGAQVNTTDMAGSHFASGSTVTLYAGWTASAKTVTISNEVTGAYANMDKAFTYTIYFQDSGGTALTGTFNYTGGVLTGSSATAPSGGTLTLGSSGEATVTLTTGQTITIAGVATSAKVRVVQTTDTNYTTSFKDSEDASSTTGADTGVRSMTAADRTFDFTNTRSVVPGGISTGSGEMVLLSLMALLALVAGLIITAVHRRRAGAR